MTAMIQSGTNFQVTKLGDIFLTVFLGKAASKNVNAPVGKRSPLPPITNRHFGKSGNPLNKTQGQFYLTTHGAAFTAIPICCESGIHAFFSPIYRIFSCCSP
jgi:hypothetical protein